MTPSPLAWWDRLPGQTWKTAVDALVTNKVRALLSTIGVAIGSGSIVLVVTAGLAGGRYVIAQIEGVGTNITYAEGVGRHPTGSVGDEMTMADLEAVRTDVPSVIDVAGSHDV